MKKFLLGLAASCLVLFAADTAKADHRHRGHHHHHHHGHHGYHGYGYTSYYPGPHIYTYGRTYYPGGYYRAYRPYGAYNYGPPVWPGYYTYGRSYYSSPRFGIYFGF